METDFILCPSELPELPPGESDVWMTVQRLPKGCDVFTPKRMRMPDSVDSIEVLGLYDPTGAPIAPDIIRGPAAAFVGDRSPSFDGPQLQLGARIQLRVRNSGPDKRRFAVAIYGPAQKRRS